MKNVPPYLIFLFSLKEVHVCSTFLRSSQPELLEKKLYPILSVHDFTAANEKEYKKWFLLRLVFGNPTKMATMSMREMCPNTEFFLVRILPHSNWIRTWKNSVFGHFSRSVYSAHSQQLKRRRLQSSAWLLFW